MFFYFKITYQLLNFSLVFQFITLCQISFSWTVFVLVLKVFSLFLRNNALVFTWAVEKLMYTLVEIKILSSINVSGASIQCQLHYYLVCLDNRNKDIFIQCTRKSLDTLDKWVNLDSSRNIQCDALPRYLFYGTRGTLVYSRKSLSRGLMSYLDQHQKETS